MALAVAVLMASCAGGAESSPEATPSAANATATSRTTAEPTESPSNTQEPEASESVTCEDGPTGTYRDTTWTDSATDDVAFLYLNDWEDLSGLVDFEAGTLLAEDTLAGLGLESDTKLKAQFVRHAAGFPNFSVFRFEGAAASSLDLTGIYAREEARFAALPDVTELLAAEIEECLDAEPALGLALMFTIGDDEFYQVSFFTQHDGAIYHLQWLAEHEGTVDLLDEMLGSWHWASDGGGFGTDADDASETGAEVLEAHVSSVVPEGDADPDPSTFTNSFASDVGQICVFAQLDVGEADTAQVSWYHEGAPVFEQDREIEDAAGWAWWCIETDVGGFDAGNWAVFVEFAGSGDRKVVSFKVTE